jgi:hypothetical protein
MAQVRNILVGAAALFLGRVEGTQPPLPTLVAGTSAATTLGGDANWRDVGFTTDGVEVAYEPDYGSVTVDQLKDAALLFASGLTVSVNTSLAEATLDNLKVAWGQHDGTLVTGANPDTAGNQDVLSMDGGALGDYPVERSLVAVGNAPRTTTVATKRERIYHARRVLSVSASTHALRRTDATVFPVSFRLLPDPTYSGSEYGKIIDRTL